LTLKGCGPGSNLEEPAAFIIQFWCVSDSGRVGVQMLSVSICVFQLALVR
jgi:hypothetical protein